MCESVNLHLVHPAAMEAVGGVLARRLAPPARQRSVVVLLHGPLGSGKTTLVRGVLRALGHDGRVPSPTYTLIEPYRLGDLQVHHLDLYRLADEHELAFLGVSDWLDQPGLTLVEWPERAPGLEALAGLGLELSLLGNVRRVVLRAGPVADGCTEGLLPDVKVGCAIT